MGLADLEAELERERRSIAMLPATAPLSRETALDLIARCQAAIQTARKEVLDKRRPDV